ncbi:acid stress-induced BolA-like protein IbaG/YrbA [Orbus hercynius]|uniref:Acid stress-induced BolA-like protein IbaG/YrbA n=1 Tax=Orbus hercynius TaxID=593135 RepID=A0A495RBC8_9GAMM|nr:BolA family protein [Orbus hercynius]RKS84699.1 acid stress-induced BolA-like protein IbaG/YrbA [Orbus hercynius]
MDKKVIEQTLNAALSLHEVHVMTEDNSHFQVIAVGDIFADLSRVKKQQAVYAPLAQFIADNSIHALSIKTYTPTEWQRERKLLGL